MEQADLAATESERVTEMQERLSTWSFAEDPAIPVFDALLDPDTFGGEEDGRLPWSEMTLD